MEKIKRCGLVNGTLDRLARAKSGGSPGSLLIRAVFEVLINCARIFSLEQDSKSRFCDD